MKRTRTLLLLALTLPVLLAACAPAFTPSSPHFVDNAAIKRPALFYPQHVGFSWVYQTPDSQPVTASLTGPQKYRGETYDTLTFTHGGTTRVEFVQFGLGGVRLVADQRGDHIFQYAPALELYPPKWSLHEGASWGGQTTVTERLQVGSKDEVDIPWHVNYKVKVVDRQNVKAGSNVFDAFKLQYQEDWTTEHDIAAKHTVTDVWFAPFVGEVRTQDGYVLMNTTVNTTFQTGPKASDVSTSSSGAN